MMPRIAHTYASGNHEQLRKYMNTSLSYIMMIAFPLMFGLISVSSHFVPIFYGKGYDKVIILMSIISPIIVFIGLSNVIGTQYLLPTKQQKKYTISVTMGAIVNLILNFILIKLYKSIGASIATVIAECVVTGVQLYLVRNEIKLTEIIKLSYKYIISSIIMFIGSMIISTFIHNHFISLLVQGVSSVMIYFCLLFIMKDTLVIDGIKLIKNKLVR
jgi:O-antigen/teichoic acid export membrane protein